MMKLSELTTALTEILRDSADILTNKFTEIFNTALADYQRYKPRRNVGVIDLIAGQSVYDAPADLIGFISHDWGAAHRARTDPWNQSEVVPIPDISVVDSVSGLTPYSLLLGTAPTSKGIAICGTEMQIIYQKAHVISNDEPGTAGATSVPAKDRDLLLLRAAAEAMLHLSTHRSARISTKDPLNGMVNRSSTPAALRQQMMDEFKRAMM